MARYFFDVKDGKRLVDPAGVDFADDQEALRHAQQFAARLAEDAKNIGHKVVVIDSQGQEIAAVVISSGEAARP